MAVKKPKPRKKAVKPKKGPKVPSQASNRANPYRPRKRSGV